MVHLKFTLYIDTDSIYCFLQRVRLLALKGVQNYAIGYPLYQILPLKQSVIRSLALPLDDPKRLVRKEAVEARSRWFLIDSTM